ncbi:hypothetical protein B5M42_000420 [Paenibacillus athensensis]|uniref:hypothetical protein n=1 Tax=Paenibacillus athensensis TaxID=1967502 RepID=UPI00106FC92E|nr:hypothetical protein [Paenibacillus athensensis]MCD1257299.1 hypothetical protein [Paenibacillus athensensis]
MNKRKAIAAILIIIFLSGCSTLPRINTNSQHELSNSATAATASELELPPKMNMENIKKAFAEFINYRLWFYPNETEKQFDFAPLVGKELTAEVRVYTSDTQSVYIQTELGDWLAKIIYSNGIVYASGFIKQADKDLYPPGNYENAGNLMIKVESPHKPNYGTSPRKDKMIKAVEEYATDRCQDFAQGTESELWKGAKVYIVDFYEYEDVVNVWFVRLDGLASYAPVQLTEGEHEFNTQGVQGYDIPDIKKLNKKDEDTSFFEKQLEDAVKQFYCS